MLNGLDLFSGIGGLTLALAPWVRPVAYCEIDRYAQGILLSRMHDGDIPIAPIWDDIRTLEGRFLPPGIDAIFGGFPCQDISVAGNGAGLAGERSGLFFEIARLIGELRPTFVFLENVPAITTRGGREVVGAFAALGYDCRWCVVCSGHGLDGFRGNRWFLLATSKSEGLQEFGWRPEESGSATGVSEKRMAGFDIEVIPRICRAPDGLPSRVDRIKCLGNAVVPLQARTAFQILSGLKVI